MTHQVVFFVLSQNQDAWQAPEGARAVELPPFG